MAVLSEANRASVNALLMSDLSAIRQPCGITKAELRAAVNAADQWADDNAPAYNLALPQPARSTLTANQKARLLMYVIRKRHEVG